MKNIYTYAIDNQEPIDKINELDALIFSVLSYISIEDIMLKLPIKIGELAKLKNLKNSKQDLMLLKIVGESNRFKDLEIIRYVNILDSTIEEQFMAMTIKIDPKTVFISYRGTNKSIVGFKEDMNMSYQVVPSQISAKEYLDKEKGYPKIYLGGHSKGGNLAMYAAMKGHLRQKLRIKKVYNFDGPGFLSLDRDFYFMRCKILNFFPEASIVGRIMQNDNHIYPVKTSKEGIEAHFVYTWYISNNTLKEGIFSHKSNEFKQACDKILNNIPDERKKVIIDYLYHMIKKHIYFNIREFSFHEIKTSLNDFPKLENDEKKEILNFSKVLIKSSLPKIGK